MHEPGQSLLHATAATAATGCTRDNALREVQAKLLPKNLRAHLPRGGNVFIALGAAQPPPPPLLPRPLLVVGLVYCAALTSC